MEIPEGGTLGDSKGSFLSVAWKGCGLNGNNKGSVISEEVLLTQVLCVLL